MLAKRFTQGHLGQLKARALPARRCVRQGCRVQRCRAPWKARARIERKGVIRVAPGPGGSRQGGQPRLLVRRLRGWLRTQLPESGATKSIAVSIVAGWPFA